MIYIGKGEVASYSRNQKLNLRISTESEVVGADDLVPILLCKSILRRLKVIQWGEILYIKITS